jgi:hypothetical protein
MVVENCSFVRIGRSCIVDGAFVDIDFISDRLLDH